MAQQLPDSYYANITADLPASPPPPGIESNFDHPVTNVYAAHVIMGISMAFATTFMALRFYVKALTKRWGWDDVSCIIGWIALIVHDAIVFTIAGPGKWLGIHLWDIRARSVLVSDVQLTLVVIILYPIASFFVKLSLFLFYLRIFRTNKTTRYLIYGGIICCGLFYSASVVIACALNIPSSGGEADVLTWVEKANEALAPTNNLALAEGAFGTLSDIFIYTIPIGSVFQLHLPRHKKFGISAIFLIGLIAIAFSICNLVLRILDLTTEDANYKVITVFIFTSAEIGSGIVCACTPLLGKLFTDDGKIHLRRTFARVSYKRWSGKGASGRPVKDYLSTYDFRGRMRARRSEPYMELEYPETGMVHPLGSSNLV